MALKNYGELKAEVASWLDRTDLTDKIPGFIKLAETKIYRALRTRENEFTYQYDDTVNPAPANPITLPQNFREMELVTLNDKPLEAISSQRYAQIKQSQYAGETRWFTIIGRELYLYPWDTSTGSINASYTIDLIFFGSESIGEMATWLTPSNPNAVPESDGTPADTTMRENDATTRLLLVAPDVLLYGAITEAYVWLREPQKAAEYKAMFIETMNDLRMEDASGNIAGSTNAVSDVYPDGDF